LKRLTDRLLAKSWSNLADDIQRSAIVTFPGVYVLAYSGNNLCGKRIDLRDVLYVGMTNARGGIRQRLKQFVCGIEKNTSHSAGRRFFTENSNATPHSLVGTRKKFFYACVEIHCNVNKSQRKASDLRKMGDVAKLEYSVLALVKEKVGREPDLNLK